MPSGNGVTARKNKKICNTAHFINHKEILSSHSTHSTNWLHITHGLQSPLQQSNKAVKLQGKQSHLEDEFSSEGHKSNIFYTVQGQGVKNN